jgi:hypothetical protein
MNGWKLGESSGSVCESCSLEIQYRLLPDQLILEVSQAEPIGSTG